MIIDCIGDTHGFYPKLEGGDLLIVAGDLTARDTLTQHSDFLEYLHKSNYKKKIVVGGNHDNFLQENPRFYSDTSIDYLCDSGTEFEGLKIWGSPWTQKFKGMNPHCMAFTLDTEEELASKFYLIPDDTDILITHGPSYGVFDKTSRGESVGSVSLLKRFKEIQPTLHVFGHIHENGSKRQTSLWGSGEVVTEINCSHVNENYEPVNKPVIIML